MITGLVEATVLVIFDRPHTRLQARAASGSPRPSATPDSVFWAAGPIRRAVAVAPVAAGPVRPVGGRAQVNCCRRREHPRHRVPPCRGQEPGVQQGREPQGRRHGGTAVRGSERVPTGPSVTLRDDFSGPFQVSRGADSQRCARWAWLDRKLQLVTLKILSIFSRNILLVFGCECKLRGRHTAQAAQAVS